MHKPDYALKAEVMECGFYSEFLRAYNLARTSQDASIREAAFEKLLFLFESCPEYFEESQRMRSASRSKQKRLRSKIENMIWDYDCSFITLTFTDDILASTSPDTRKQYVRKYLKENCPAYVANIDFGKLNDREHYHAIVASQHVNLDPWRKYGNINIERIRYSLGSSGDATCKRLSKYITKLCNHAVKNTTKRNNVIYSR